MPVQIVKDSQTIRIKGELTFDTVMVVWKDRKSFLANTNDCLTVDLSEVVRADSAGVALLCELKSINPQLNFEHISEKLQNIIQLSGLSKVL